MKNTLTIAFIFLVLILNSCNQSNSNIESVATNSKKKLILTIDGGGIKGIIPAYFLTQLEAALNKKTYQLFDVIGGTSTGGIISIVLTTPYNQDNSPRSAQELLDFYLNDCGNIFYKNDQPPPGPKYYANSYGIEPFLQQQLGATQSLADAAKNLSGKKVAQVFTVSYLVNSSGGTVANPTIGEDFGPYLFNWYDAINDATQNYFLWEAARATSAAPVYFPLATVGGRANGRSSANPKWAIDGGVMSNDPAVWGISEMFRTDPSVSLDDIILISLGCGINKFNGGLGVTNEHENPWHYGQKYGFWGELQWGAESLKNLNGDPTPRSVITETALYANQFAAVIQMGNIVGNTRYFRVQPELKPDLTPMDNCSNAAALLSFARSYFSEGEGQAQLNAIISVVKQNL